MVGRTARGMRSATLVLAGILAACSGTTTETTTTVAPATSAPTTTAAPPTTTTAAPPPTTTTVAPTTTVDPLARPDVLVSNVNRNSIDDFDTSGDNVYEMVVELLDLFAYLEGAPTDNAEQMVGLVFERAYPYWNPIMVGFLELTDNPGWHYVDPGDELIATDVVELSADSATLRIVHQRGKQLIADADGRIVKEYDASPLRVTNFTISLGQDGLWRFADVSPSEAIASDEIESMLPIEWEGRRS